MVAPAPVNPPGQMQIAQPPNGSAAGLSDGLKTTRHFLRAFGFHVLAVLLGIALAFM
jgi:hypothetical protein